MTRDIGEKAVGIDIRPGMWRPMYDTESIAWISPPWMSREYIWLDFPEAIFCNKGLLVLSHVNPEFPSLFPDLPPVEWQKMHSGICFERTLPACIHYGGHAVQKYSNTVCMELWIKNISDQPLTDITLQTCAYMHNIKEFADKTNVNKIVHVADKGWWSLEKTLEMKGGNSNYHVGWREGPKVVDLPYTAALSNVEERIVAMTWGKNTFSLTGNPDHPCIHADPYFDDLDPGEKQTIEGEMIFFVGNIQQFNEAITSRRNRII